MRCNSCGYNDQLITSKAGYFAGIIFDFIAGATFSIINVEITQNYILLITCNNNDNNDTVTHPQNIAEEFNRYFVNVGKRMSDLIPPADPNVEHNTKKNYSPSNSLFLDPATASEVETLIDQLSNQKTKRQLDIETKFIKLSKYVISTPLSEFFNLCITQYNCSLNCKTSNHMRGHR